MSSRLLLRIDPETFSIIIQELALSSNGQHIANNIQFSTPPQSSDGSDGTDLRVDYHMHRDLKIAISYACERIAFARGDGLFVCRPRREHGDRSDRGDFMKLEACSLEGETITALHWVTMHSHGHILIVGSSEGFAKFYTECGRPIFERRFQSAPVLRIKNKCSAPDITRSKRGSSFDLNPHSNDDIIIVYSRMAVKLPMESLCAFLNVKILRMGDETVEQRREEQMPSLTFHAWYLTGQFKVNDVACFTELRPASVFDLLNSHTSQEKIIGVGSDPTLVVYDGNATETGIISASKIATKIATKVTTAVYSFAKSFLVGDEPSAIDSRQNRPLNNNGSSNNLGDSVDTYNETTRPIPVRSRYGMDDFPREINSIVLDRSNRYAITADSLGRVMLIDVQMMLVMYILKGYRDAFVGWTYNVEDQQDQCFVVFSPLRGILEIRSMISMEVLWKIDIGNEATVLTIPPMVCLPCDAESTNLRIEASDFAILSPNGVIHVLNTPATRDKADGEFNSAIL